MTRHHCQHEFLLYRRQQILRIIQHPERYKVCEGCGLPWSQEFPLCPECHAYRFNHTPEAVRAAARYFSNPSYIQIIPRGSYTLLPLETDATHEEIILTALTSVLTTAPEKEIPKLQNLLDKHLTEIPSTTN